MPSNPVRELIFRDVTCSDGQNRRYDISFGGIEIMVVDPKKGGDGKKTDSLVAVAIRMA